ncbi:hypothetical protein [Marinobacter sp. SS21]|uniref:hypothetical protein n=1 Tax=Marinobacter sp. SS21 TaxID=2979460 RepID=UPI00232E2C8F|nr:hypothetical protein [Marinobacter sp. SS21]MDC0661080.1 hypothetical protein [Marinobacter sp. SS21]
MRRGGYYAVGLLCLAVGLSSPALAWELIEDRLFFNTYGTLGVAAVDDDDVAIDNLQDQDIGDEPSAGFDSRLGLQLEYRVNERWNITWQGLATRDEDDDYELDTKWAYIDFDAASWLTVRLGRFITPLFQISEQRYVGYSQPWARPPLEVYGLENDFDHSDGLWFALRLPTTGVATTLDLFVSRHHSADLDVEIEPIYGAALNVTRNNLNLRLMLANLSIDLDHSELAGLDQLLQQPSAEHEYRFDSDFLYYNLGFQYNDHRWLALLEYIHLNSEGHFYPELEAFTITVGRYLDVFLPYAVYSKRSVLNTEPETGLTGMAGVVANSLIDARKSDQSTLGMGLRWDVLPGLAVKGQWDHIRIPPDSRGVFDRDPDGHVNLYTLVLDWAF